MLRRFFRRAKKVSLVPPQALSSWIEAQVRAQMPRALIYQQLLDMQFQADDPLSYHTAAQDVMAIMLLRNHQGSKLELTGRIQAAIEVYEANVRDLYAGIYPYQRLLILYKQGQAYANAIRVCEAYLCLPQGDSAQSAQAKAVFTRALQQLKHKLD